MSILLALFLGFAIATSMYHRWLWQDAEQRVKWLESALWHSADEQYATAEDLGLDE